MTFQFLFEQFQALPSGSDSFKQGGLKIEVQQRCVIE